MRDLRKRDWALAAIIVCVCAAIAFFSFWNLEDHRITYDKEGKYLPVLSLKELALAMHGYDAAHGRLPPAAVCNQDGVPLLSWRVLLLPYLEQTELFRQFKLDEPWDSPQNLRLLPKMPNVYSPLAGRPPLEPYTTLFQIFVGKGTAFERCEGLRLNEAFPRPSYTILVAEAGKSVPWTKPEDIVYDEDRPLPMLGGFFDGCFHVALVDGSARVVRQGTDMAKVRSAIVRNSDGPWPWGDD
jgi:hypothetical protein